MRVVCFIVLCGFALTHFFHGVSSAGERLTFFPPEQVQNDDVISPTKQATCDAPEGYIVYLIDNFDQEISDIQGLKISHGELMRAMLVSGRDDIRVKSLNTALSTGLAKVLKNVMDGECVDAVVSSIPGSNYSYGQISSFFSTEIELHDGNILDHQSNLRELMLGIAVRGFPSVEWLLQLDANPVKVREDAQKIFYIEALGELGVPIFLPYGNVDELHRGQERAINLLSIADHASIFSALGSEGQLLEGFPSSPLSDGAELALYRVEECPVWDDSLHVNIDVNQDNYTDFIQKREGGIPYYDQSGSLNLSPPLLSSLEFTHLVRELVDDTLEDFDEEIVITAAQYLELQLICPGCIGRTPAEPLKDFVWLNSGEHGSVFTLNGQCRQRGEIRGTSLIPPMKVKELLPRKKRYGEAG